jgi:ParB/RepB/Spo0J family partition protein
MTSVKLPKGGRISDALTPNLRRATRASLEDLARDEILYLPIAAIDPDPEQPRLDVDDELADSIKQHGVLQAIQVRPHPSGADDRWQIVDGERRWRGAVKAKADTIPATITLEVEDVGDRIIRQIVRNEGKPLTPAEEAIAFKRIIASKQLAGDKRYGLVHLAKELGIPKSTVSDRLAMTEIPAFWMPLIVNGPLQPSHVPLLHRWRKVPEKFQQRALEQMQADYRWAGHVENRARKGDRIYIGTFKTLLDTFMYKFIKPVADVPGYVGPTDTFESRSAWPRKRLVHAMDPSKWRPIWHKGIAARRAKSAGKKSSADSGADRWEAQQKKQNEAFAREERKRAEWLKAVPAMLDAAAAVVARADASAGGPLADVILAELDVRRASAAGKLIPRGTTADGFVRHLAMIALVNLAGDRWEGHKRFPALAKSLGLDVKSLLAGSGGAAVDDAETEEPEPVDAGAEYDITDDDVQLVCKYCGCDDLNACELDDGPCGWVSSEPPVCSNPSCVVAWQNDSEESEESPDALQPAEAL